MTKTRLKHELEQARETGVAFDHEGGYDGVDGIAAIIRDASGKAVASIGFACRYPGLMKPDVSGWLN